jgi:uncharacterized MnhB-related membrane protein
MDEGARQVLKMKFIKLAMLLNVVIITAALTVVMYFKFSDITGQSPDLNLPVAAVFAVLTVVLTLIFWRNYQADRNWLNEQPD